MRDYTYEILKFLYDNGGKADAELLMAELTKDTVQTKIKNEQSTIANKIINMSFADNDFVEILLSSSAELLNRYVNSVKQRFDDSSDITLQIRPKGEEKYWELIKDIIRKN